MGCFYSYRHPLLLIKSQTKSTLLKNKIHASPNDRFGLKRPNDRFGFKDANKAGPAVLRAKLLYCRLR